MPPKKLPQRTSQQNGQSQGQSASVDRQKNKPTTTKPGSNIPESEVKKNSSMSAQLALEAAKKAYDLRQAAYGAGDPEAREQILAKAINKEIEAESFGKAAKYTRSGAFQGLAAGAGLGVQPGVVLGQLTGALVGGLLASVGGLVGGGVGSAYGAIKGPFWDLGQMASHGVRSIVGDFPNWKATSSQKKALEKMVLGAQQTKPPNQEELEQMRDDNGGLSHQEYQQSVNAMTSWIPSMPSMPDISSSMPSLSSLSSLTGSRGQPARNVTTATGNSAMTASKPSNKQQAKAPADPRVSSRPQNATSHTSGPAIESQNTSRTNKDTPKRRPKKLEIRSKSTTSQSGQSSQPTVRKPPPKLAVQTKPATANT